MSAWVGVMGILRGVLAFLAETLYLARRSAVCVDLMSTPLLTDCLDITSTRSTRGTGMYVPSTHTKKSEDQITVEHLVEARG